MKVYVLEHKFIGSKESCKNLHILEGLPIDGFQTLRSFCNEKEAYQNLVTYSVTYDSNKWIYRLRVVETNTRDIFVTANISFTTTLNNETVYRT
jgi:hypothetical protein